MRFFIRILLVVFVFLSIQEVGLARGRGNRSSSSVKTTLAPLAAGQQYNIINVGSGRCLVATGPRQGMSKSGWLKTNGVPDSAVIAPIVMAFPSSARGTACASLDRAKWVLKHGTIKNGGVVVLQNVATHRLLFQLGSYDVQGSGHKAWHQQEPPIISLSSDPVVVATESNWYNRAYWALKDACMQKGECYFISTHAGETVSEAKADVVGQVLMDTTLPMSKAYREAAKNISNRFLGASGVWAIARGNCSRGHCTGLCFNKNYKKQCTAVISVTSTLMKLKWPQLKLEMWKFVPTSS